MNKPTQTPKPAQIQRTLQWLPGGEGSEVSKEGQVYGDDGNSAFGREHAVVYAEIKI